MSSPLFHQLVLSSFPGIGPGLYWKLIQHFGTAENVLSQSFEHVRPWFKESQLIQESREIQGFFNNRDQNKLVEKAIHTLEWCENNEVHIIAHDDSRYPDLLQQIKRRPPLLYVKGEPEILSMPQIAVVGSRNPTPTGKSNATIFCSELAANGFVITSGLALGIDAAAHRGALKGQGKTIAVMGTGINELYPKRNTKLADEILAAGGALVSEFPLGTSPTPQNFPQRNRIISGLSYGTLVVEAAIKSGSLISAKYALEQNREVFAIPGAIQNPMSKGCHALIKQGAHLVESTADIYQELQSFVALSQQRVQREQQEQQELFSLPDTITSMEKIVYEAIDYSPVAIDDLVERTGLATGELMSGLMSLELKSLVQLSCDGYQRAVRE